MKNKTLSEQMSAVYNYLENSGNKEIKFLDNGLIETRYGKQTFNTWLLNNDGTLTAIDCRVIY